MSPRDAAKLLFTRIKMEEIDFHKLEDVRKLADYLERKYPEFKQFIVKYPNRGNYNITMHPEKALAEGAELIDRCESSQQ